MTATAQMIEDLEDEYLYFAQKAKNEPSRWGIEDTLKMDRVARVLRAMYEKNDVPELDRIAL